MEFGPAGQGWAKNSSVSDSARIEALPFSRWFIFSLFPRLSAAWDKGEQGLDPSRSPPGKNLELEQLNWFKSPMLMHLEQINLGINRLPNHTELA